MEDNKPKSKADKILAKFARARQKRQLKDAKWKELDEFDRGEQWEHGNKMPPWIPRPVTNYVHLVKTIKRAALAMENPTGKVRAQSPYDQEKARTIQKAYEYVWEKTKSRKLVREVLDTGKLLGTGIAQIYWEENTPVMGGTGGLYEGEIRVKQIDPASFYPDPSAFTIDDCQFIHIVERKPVEWLKKHPLFKDKMNNVEQREVADNERGEIYSRDYNSVESSKDGMIDFHSHFEKKPHQEGGFIYSVTYLAGEKIVHEIERLRPNCYPFAIFQDYPQRQDFWAKSTCELVLDNQKLLNKVESIIALIGTLLQNPQKVVSKQSGIDPREAAKYGSAPGHTFVANGDPSRAMIWQNPPQIPQALFNLAEQARENIREVTGITETYMGQSVGSLQTSSGVNQLMERATLRDRDQMYDLELFIEQYSWLLIRFMLEYYDEPRYIRITGTDGEEMFEEFVGVDFRDVEFDLHVDVSGKTPISRQRLKDEAEQLLNIQGQYQYSPAVITPKEFIKMTDFQNKDEIMNRMDYEEQNNFVEQAMNVAMMITEAMQGGVPPEEIEQMATSMFQQLEDNKNRALGNTSNSGQIQAQQQGV